MIRQEQGLAVTAFELCHSRLALPAAIEQVQHLSRLRNLIPNRVWYLQILPFSRPIAQARLEGIRGLIQVSRILHGTHPLLRNSYSASGKALSSAPSSYVLEGYTHR